MKASVATVDKPSEKRDRISSSSTVSNFAIESMVAVLRQLRTLAKSINKFQIHHSCHLTMKTSTMMVKITRRRTTTTKPTAIIKTAKMTILNVVN